MSGLTRRPAFWIVYALLAIGALVVAARLFPVAIPIVNLDVKATRDDALAHAEADAARLRLSTPGYRSAVRFSHDGETQNYVELAGGGKSAFASLVAGSAYAPYWWDVRLFAPGVIDEVTLRYKPDGTFNGFSRRVAETYVRDPATRALDGDDARALAEEHARSDWGVDLAPYHLLDQSQETRPSGRVDHRFVYERPEALGDARIRLSLDVAGDELVAITPFVHIPESFERRYEELRSANDLIAGIAALAAALLWGLGGCLLGTLWLARQRALQWRPAVVAGLVIGLLLALSTLAAAPSAWFGVDTTQSATTFWLREVALATLLLLGGGLGLALVFMAAEGLSRRAYPHMPQLWQLWSREGGSSVQTAGRTLGGYLFVPIELGLIAAFYYATNRYLGWWQPSELLTDPNVLGSSVPALTPIALSLQAGFLEECLFRAIPLSLGALIGARYGRRTLGIAIAFVLQALVFGGAHANYPGFPSYSRPVELLLPSMVWALIFLRFGLLPTILLHATFDLSLFSIPVFLVDAPGARIQQAIIVIAALVPLFVLLVRRLRTGRFTEMPASLYNGAWKSVAAVNANVERAVQPLASDRASIALQRGLPFLGIVGLLTWIALTPFHADVPGLPMPREQAESVADAAVLAQHGNPGAPFRRFSAIREANGEPSQWTSHKFVWREGGPALYRQLVGTWLAPPVWEVRYALFEGDVAQRAEEWRVTVAAGPEVRTVRHTLPESRPGAKLGRDAAQAIAEQALRERYRADPAQLRLVTADESQRTARIDWTFHFADPAVRIPAGGEARYLVQVAGDEVAAAGRYIYVPEAWLRAESVRANLTQVATLGAAILVLIAGLIAIVIGVIGFTRHRTDNRALRFAAAVAAITAIGAGLNLWPTVGMILNTAEPVASQITMRVLGGLAAALVLALLVGLMAGVGSYGARIAHPHAIAGRLPPWLAAVAASLFLAGVGAAAGALVPASAPQWPVLDWANQWSSLLGSVLTGFNFLSAAVVALFVFYVLTRITADWTRRAWLVVLIVVVLDVAGTLAAGGLAGSGEAVVRAAVAGLVGGCTATAVVWLFLRYDPRMIPAFVATTLIVDRMARAARADATTAWIDAVVASAVTIAIAVAITRYLAHPLPHTTQPAIPPGAVGPTAS